jgi:hypothetical protein
MEILRDVLMAIALAVIGQSCIRADPHFMRIRIFMHGSEDLAVRRVENYSVQTETSYDRSRPVWRSYV